VTDDDLHPLRDLGLSDEQILDVVLITAYYSFMTRVADALGVELDERIKLHAASRP
jgi:alkylhydroperoxidase family enzyme